MVERWMIQFTDRVAEELRRTADAQEAQTSQLEQIATILNGMAAATERTATPSLQTVGIEYCTVHHGTRNEDDPDARCDWQGNNPLKPNCKLVPLVYVP